jgi:stage V sporulation protein G
MKVTINKITKIKNADRSPLKAFVDISIEDCIIVRGLKVINGRCGLFVSMPMEQDLNKKWYNTVDCLNKKARTEINTVVLKAYNNQ